MNIVNFDFSPLYFDVPPLSNRRLALVAGHLQTCVCGKRFSVEHVCTVMFQRRISFCYRHNEVCDITTAATLFTEVSNDVCTEADLQPLMSNPLRGTSATQQDGTWLDMLASGVEGLRIKLTLM